MREDFDDFCLYMYVTVDDIWQKVAPLFKRPGPEPACSDSELLTMALVGECRGWDLETDLLSHWQEHRDLSPVYSIAEPLQSAQTLLTSSVQPDPKSGAGDARPKP